MEFRLESSFNSTEFPIDSISITLLAAGLDLNSVPDRHGSPGIVQSTAGKVTSLAIQSNLFRSDFHSGPYIRSGFGAP